MPRHSTYRSRSTVDSVGGELSSGQLGVGIFVAIVFGLVCFILGYVVANVDRPLQMAEATVNKNPAVTAAAPTPESASETAPPQPPVEERTEAPQEEETSSTPAVTGPSRRPSDVANRVGPGARTIEPLPAPGAPTPMTRTSVNISNLQGDKPESTSKPAESRAPIIPPGSTAAAPAPAPTPDPAPAPAPVAAPTPAPAPAPAPAADSPGSDLDTLASNKPAAKPPAAKPAAPKPEAKPPAGAPTVRRGAYGVQVAAFNGPRRKDQAEESRKRLKETAGLSAEIITSPDGAYEKVVVTGFSTRDEANVQCEKLKAKTGYASSWVIRLP